MIDLHFHVLPGMDDGPPDLDAAVELARAAVDAGTTALVATPHVNWDFPNTAASIAVAVRRLNAELASRSIRLRVYPGAEVALTHAFDLAGPELRGLRLGGGPWLLVEAPHTPAASGVEGMLLALQQHAPRIVLAHVERCPAFLEDRDLLRRLVEAGMLASITAGSLVGRFGSEARTSALRFLAAGLIHNVASDGHNITTRPPGVLRELAGAGLGPQADWLTRQVPTAILRGTALPPAPAWPAPPVERHRFLLRRR